MSMTPPRSAFTAAAKRQRQVDEALAPATITLNGADYAGAAVVSSATWELQDGGFKWVVRFMATICKGLLATEPAQGSIAVIDGKGYKVNEVGGQNEFDEQWVLRGMRTPGRDEVA